MDDNLQNRMVDAPRKRGRPTNAEISGRQPPVEQSVASVPEIIDADTTLPREGIACLHCGRQQFPRITTTTGLSRYVSCALCGKKMRIDYAADMRTRVMHKL